MHYSLPLATWLARQDYELYGKSDLRFVEGVYKVLGMREEMVTLFTSSSLSSLFFCYSYPSSPSSFSLPLYFLLSFLPSRFFVRCFTTIPVSLRSSFFALDMQRGSCR